MSAWLDPVRHALATYAAHTTFFFRDDDGGWADENLYRLLDITMGVGAPIALAAIPAAVSSVLAADLRERLRTHSPIISVHQHGFAHANHEPTGRKSEFGPSRSPDAQRHDIAQGRDRLQQLLGLALPPIFTPPWNRCTCQTAECLIDLGFEILSRDLTAEAFGLDRLREIPVCLDWTGRSGARRGPDQWGVRIAGTITRQMTVGVMLHHAVMSPDDHQMLRAFLEVLSEYQVRTRQMLHVASPAVPRAREVSSCGR